MVEIQEAEPAEAQPDGAAAGADVGAQEQERAEEREGDKDEEDRERRAKKAYAKEVLSGGFGYERAFSTSDVLASYTVYAGEDAGGKELAGATNATLSIAKFKESWVECASVVADVLCDMLAGERCTVRVEPEATGLDNGEPAFIELELHQILREVAKLRRGDPDEGEPGVLLRRREGSRDACIGRVPLLGSTGSCRLRLAKAVPPELSEAGVRPRFFGADDGAGWPEVGEWWECEYECGDGELAEGVDLAVRNARSDELWTARVRGEHCFPDVPVDALGRDGTHDLFAHAIELEIRQEDFVGGGTGIDMRIEEKVERGEACKKRGNKLFKAGRLRRAEAVFSEGADLFNVVQSEDFDETGQNARYNRLSEKHQRPLLLNVALCKIKRGAHKDALQDLNEVLLHDSKNVKALYRRGLVHLELENFADARTDLEKAAHIDTSLRREVDRELTRLKRKMNEATVAEKKAYKHLFDTSRHRELVYTDAEIKASEATGKDLPHYVQPTHVEKALRIDNLDAEFAEIDEEEAELKAMREQAKKQYYTGGRLTKMGLGMGI